MVDKRAVVADHHHRLSVLDQEILQPLDRLDIQVVGRLVEQQHVGLLQQQLGQLDTHPPATAEFAGLACEVLALETQPEQRLFDVGVVVDLLDRVELLAQGRYPFDQLHVAVRLVIRARLQLFVDRFDLGLHLMQVGECLRRLLKYRASVLGHQMLWKISDYRIFWGRNLSAARFAYPGQYLEQSRFARPVLAHQGDPVFLVNHERYICKEGAAAKLYCKSIN